LKESQHQNWMKAVYDAIGEDELLREISALLTPDGFDSELQVVYQTMEALRQASPEYTGDWYFTGDYPTPGGFITANRALINYMENKHQRAY